MTFTTTGDQRLDEPLRTIGAKGLFTHELEVALASGSVDCCVHSLKDLPTDSPAGLEIVALLEREDPRDVLVLGSLATVGGLTSLSPGARVGTSSLRRRAQLAAIRPDLEIVELRGNVPTRIRKVDAGEVDAAILAAAGLVRLNARHRISQFFESPHWLPAAGQGAIAVQARAGDNEMHALLASLDHSGTRVATTAERGFLAALEGGCQVPIGALAAVDLSSPDGRMLLQGFVSDTGGNVFVRGSIVVDVAAPAESGRALAAELRGRGAIELLRELRARDQSIAPQPE